MSHGILAALQKPDLKRVYALLAVLAVGLLVVSALPSPVRATGVGGGSAPLPQEPASVELKARSAPALLTHPQPHAGNPASTSRHFMPFVCQFCAWSGSAGAFASEYQNVSLNITDIAQEGYYLSSNLSFASRGYEHTPQNLSTWAWNNKKADFPIITACSIPDISRFLANPALWNTFINRSINASNEYFYQGYVLDFEPNASCGGGFTSPELGVEYAQFAEDFGYQLYNARLYGVPLKMELFVTVSLTDPNFWNVNALSQQPDIQYFMLQDFTCNPVTFQDQATLVASALTASRMDLVLSPQGCAGSPAELADLSQEIRWINTTSYDFNWISYWALDDGAFALPSGLWPSIHGFVEPNVYNETNSLYENVPSACVGRNVCFIPQSQYIQYFLSNFSFPNIFGLYSSVNAGRVVLTPSGVEGIVQGTSYAFPNPSSGTQPWNETIDMGTLHPGAVLELKAVFANGEVIWGNETLSLLWSPPFLMELLTLTNLVTLSDQASGEWNNTYSFTVSTDWDLTYQLGFGISLKFGGGDYSLFPDAVFGITVSSDAHVTLFGDFKFTSPEIDLAGISCTISAELDVSGTFSVANSSITWTSGEVDLIISADASVSYPIAGIDLGPVTIGITLTIDVNPSLTLQFILGPTTNPNDEFIPGLEAMLTQILGNVAVPLTIEVSLDAGIASITGGATLTITVYFSSQNPYILGGSVVGTVFISWEVDLKVVSFSGTLWSMTGTIYQWGTVPSAVKLPAASPYNGPPTRYYNNSLYDTPGWSLGSLLGTLVQDIYPRTKVAEATSGPNVLYAYTTDNVGQNANVAASLQGVLFNTVTRAETNLDLPLVAGSENFDPELTTLPNGNVQAVWDAVPFSALAATDPTQIAPVHLETAQYDASSGTWGPVSQVTPTAVADAYQVSSCNGVPEAAVLLTPSILSSSGSLNLYDLTTGDLIESMPVSNAQDLTSFSCARHLVVLETTTHQYVVENLSSLGTWSVPSVAGYTPTQVDLGQNGSTDVAVLYQNRSQGDLAIVYNANSGATVGSVPVSSGTTGLSLLTLGGVDYLGVGDSEGTTVYQLSPGYHYIFAEAPARAMQSFGLSAAGDDLVIDELNNYGSASAPLLDLNASVVPLTTISTPVALPATLDAGQTLGLSVETHTAWGTGLLAWSGLPAGCSSGNTTTLSCTPSTPGTYSVRASVTDASGFTTWSAPVLVTVDPLLVAGAVSVAPSAVKVGEEALFTAQPSGGSGLYDYTWSGLPAGCLSADTATLPCYPTTAGNYTVAVLVQDSFGAQGTATSAGLEVERLATVTVPGSSPGPAKSSSGGFSETTVALLAVLAASLAIVAVLFFVVLPRRPGSGGPSAKAGKERHAPGTSKGSEASEADAPKDAPEAEPKPETKPEGEAAPTAAAPEAEGAAPTPSPASSGG